VYGLNRALLVSRIRRCGVLLTMMMFEATG